MELFARLFGGVLVFVYHCFDRLVTHGYLSALSRPEQWSTFSAKWCVLLRRTQDYQRWVEAFAAHHDIPIAWTEKGVRKQDDLRPYLRQMDKQRRYGVYFILKSLEQGTTFRSTPPKYPTADPHYRLLVKQRSHFTHYYFYLRDETLGPLVMRVASFVPFHTTYYLNGHSFVEQEFEPRGRRFPQTGQCLSQCGTEVGPTYLMSSTSLPISL
jgi:hypothetical protein